VQILLEQSLIEPFLDAMGRVLGFACTAKKEAAVSICNLQLVVMWLINVPFYVLY
jgi:hypothetical protein